MILGVFTQHGPDQPLTRGEFAIPSALRREASVVGLISSISAAPPGPNTFPAQAASAASMLARSWARISDDVMTAGRLSGLARAVAGEGGAPGMSGRSMRKRSFCA